jgi:hypothetical protein
MQHRRYHTVYRPSYTGVLGLFHRQRPVVIRPLVGDLLVVIS